MNLNQNALDRYITGNYGEDQFHEDEEDDIKKELQEIRETQVFILEQIKQIAKIINLAEEEKKWSQKKK